MSNPNNNQKGNVPRKETIKPKVKKPVIRNQRPEGFNDIESMAKDLLNASGINYFEWLDALHKKVVLDELTKNKDIIVDLLND